LRQLSDNAVAENPRRRRLYTVIEHQSTPDAHMAFRLMRYALAAMQRHLDAGHKTLPLVVPMLFYHGAKSPTPSRFAGWMSLLTQNGATLYAAAFPLVDIGGAG
jgi:predicted transposase/invertase (TIGR01784 family)